MVVVAGPLIVAALGCRGEAPVVRAEPGTLAVADRDHVRFVALGDGGKATPVRDRVADAVVEHCRERGCDFVVLLGDLVYPRGLEGPTDPHAERHVVAPWAEVGVPIVAVLGNHDYAHGGNRERAGWMIEWAQGRDDVVMPGHFWALQAGPVSLIGLDTADAIRFGAEPQLGWLVDTLADHAEASWVVAFGHHPRWSNGPHGNAGTYEGWWGVPFMSGVAVERLLEPLEGRAQLYLAGHDHTRQIIERDGFVQVVSGAAASVTRIVDRGNDPTFASATPGFAWVDVRPDAATVQLVDDQGRVDAEITVPR